MKISKIRLSNFRIFKNETTIELGRRLTIISGINGVGKSTILAALVNGTADTDTPVKPLVGQSSFSVPFESLVSYDEKGDRTGSNVLTISYKDVPKHIEADELSDGNSVDQFQDLNIKFRTHKLKIRNKDQYRYRLLPQKIAGIRNTEAKLTWPTLYLGLGRLSPTGESQTVQVSEIDNTISNNVVSVQKELMYDSILEDIKSIRYIQGSDSNQQHAGMDTESFSVKSNSVGQDNLSQILLLIESFRRLKLQDEYNYHGGLLAIDEIDAGLHPAVQISLVKYLLKEAEELDLQIAFTTHSITLLEEISETLQDADKVLINYIDLKPSTGEPDVIKSPSVSFFKNNLANKIYKTTKPKEKIHVLLEDRVAQDYLKKIISRSGNDNLNKLNILDVDIDWSHALKLSQSDPKAFKNWIFILDPDVPNLIGDKETYDGRPYSYIINDPRRSNILTLPGTSAIERMVWEFIKNSKGNDFWDRMGIRELGYRYETICHDNAPIFIPDKEESKQPTIVYKNWHSDHPELYEQFLNLFIETNFDKMGSFINNLSSLQSIIEQRQAGE